MQTTRYVNLQLKESEQTLNICPQGAFECGPLGRGLKGPKMGHFKQSSHDPKYNSGSNAMCQYFQNIVHSIADY